MLLRSATMICCCALLGGCFSMPWKKPAALRPEIISFPTASFSDGTHREPRLIGKGKVSMVNTAGKFVLLECDAWGAPAEGTALKSLRYGAETAILAASKERRGSYVVADIVKGEPQRGDEVFQ
jgi:hypothetical protein